MIENASTTYHGRILAPSGFLRPPPNMAPTVCLGDPEPRISTREINTTSENTHWYRLAAMSSGWIVHSSPSRPVPADGSMNTPSPMIIAGASFLMVIYHVLAASVPSSRSVHNIVSCMIILIREMKICADLYSPPRKLRPPGFGRQRGCYRSAQNL